MPQHSGKCHALMDNQHSTELIFFLFNILYYFTKVQVDSNKIWVAEQSARADVFQGLIKCALAFCDSDNLGLLLVWLFTLSSCRSIYLWTSSGLTLWPARAYVRLSIPGMVPRWLWKVFNELSGKEKVVLAHQHSSLLPVSASHCYLQPYLRCFLLS